MKVFFVGDGKHDVGAPEMPTGTPYAARGVVTTLARRVVPDAIGDDSVAFRWAELTRLSPSKKRGLTPKAKAAVVVARRYHCTAVVAVVDHDGDDDRLEALKKAQEGSPLPLACGMAIRTIEAWTLGAPSALAAVLGVDEAVVRARFAVNRVEDLNQRNEKDPKRRSKDLLRDLAESAKQQDCLELREDVANSTDIEELAQNCPNGFAPFVTELREVFAQK